MARDMGNDKPVRRAVALNGYGTPFDDGRRRVIPWHDFVQIAETAEETGYEAIFMPEIGAREAFSALAGLVPVTSRARLATGVVPFGSRDLRRMAMEAVTLDDMSGGRFVLGLGSRLPIEATRRRIEGVRALLAGRGEVTVDGEAVPGLDLHAEPGRVPIYLAALGPRMTELAGASADGVLLNWCTPDRVARARVEVARGAEREGRDPAEVTVAVYVRACLGHEEVHAREVLAEAASQYAGMPRYARQFEAMGLGEEARAAATRAAAVPEALLEAVCVWGSRDDALGKFGAFGEAGADLVVVYPVPALDAVTSLMATILAAAPSTAVER